jgi:hypothetical protein
MIVKILRLSVARNLAQKEENIVQHPGHDVNGLFRFSGDKASPKCLQCVFKDDPLS